jgi:toxin FitB
MRILDSNIIIYASQTTLNYLTPFLKDPNNFVSEITKLEVLGFHNFDNFAKQQMTELFDNLNIIPINSIVIDKAISLRQNRKMAMGDSIIAATALIFGYELITRNVKDFEKLNIKVTNPMP